MLRNRISCVMGIVMLKANVIITSPQSAFHNFIEIHKVQHQERPDIISFLFSLPVYLFTLADILEVFPKSY